MAMFDMKTWYGRPMRSFFVIALVIFLLWMAAVVFGINSWLKAYSTQPVADSISGINALFAGLAVAGVIVTLLLQIYEAKETAVELKNAAEANLKMVQANQELSTYAAERAVLDVFQTYCSEYFQGVKNSSQTVLILCVMNKEYCDFLVSRLFVADPIDLTPALWERLPKKAGDTRTFDAFKSDEQHHRFKLDELINFFTLLVGQSNSKQAISRCDFSYSWWRPLLWMIALRQQERYDASARIRQFAIPPHLKRVVQGLDGIYGLTPFEPESAFWEYFHEHPKVVAYGPDPLYREFLV
jgi:hypothetical protein